ncbi:hypothetical protein [Kistimonas asteriae]|uniref:hypothetical protein n=1 Tax=Kistimonas asteriae TaxID=517724 RepID=UPI001BA5786E|nr:hypothetical protein [Kistimonas asteriae]
MNNLTIPNRPPGETAQDFFALRNEAVETIQRLAGTTWTDHNLHDPGITLLEAACFAITDLGYRLDFPVPDLMAPGPDSPGTTHFWGRAEVLPCASITADDYRRLMLDLQGVRNVSVSTQEDRPSLWDIQVIPEPGAPVDLVEQVRQCYLDHRNLGEDLGRLEVLETYPVVLKLNITVADGIDTASTVAQLLARLADYIAPRIRFQSRDDMLSAGITPDELSTGPWLERGYLSADMLALPALHNRLYVSRLMTEALSVNGIEQVETLQVTDATWPDDDTWESWIYSPLERKAPFLDLAKTLAYTTVVKQGVAVSVDKDRIQSQYDVLLSPFSAPGRAKETLLSGRYRTPGDYLSIQHDLPVMYGVGQAGLAAGERLERVAQVQQLQAYLLLFDQVLSNQFAQLGHARTLLGLPESDGLQPLQQVMEKMQASASLSDTDISGFWQAISALPPTWQSQPVQELQQLPAILAEHLPDYFAEAFQRLTEMPFSDDHLERLGRSLEHQLARFHEQVPDSALLKYEELYSHYSDRLLTHRDAPTTLDADQLTRRLAQLKSALDRAAFLLDLPATGSHRGQSGDYANPTIWGKGNVSGLRHRIYRRLGLPMVAMNSLATHNGEGFHLVEGTLLRHGEDDSGDKVDAAFHEIYVVIPSWPSRLADPDFRQLFVDTLLQELPAHLTPRLLWLDRACMADFESVYNSWRNALSRLPAQILDEQDTLRQYRVKQSTWFLNRFIQDGLAGTPPDISDWPLTFPSLGETPIGQYTIGYTRVDSLAYDPEATDAGRIGTASINPDDNSADEPFVTRIRTPYSTRDKD